MIKRQYWVNTKAARSHPYRNNIHIKITGDEKSLCGRNINAEFDKSQDHWKQTDNPNRRKICKRCAVISKKLGNRRDSNVTESLNTLNKERNEIKEENSLINHDPSTELENLRDDAIILKSRAEFELKFIIEEWKKCNPEDDIKMFAKMNSIKQFIDSCSRLNNNL